MAPPQYPQLSGSRGSLQQVSCPGSRCTLTAVRRIASIPTRARRTTPLARVQSLMSARSCASCSARVRRLRRDRVSCRSCARLISSRNAPLAGMWGAHVSPAPHAISLTYPSDPCRGRDGMNLAPQVSAHGGCVRGCRSDNIRRRHGGVCHGFCQISDHGAFQARDLFVAGLPPDSARAVSLPDMAPDFASLSEF